MFCHLLLFYTKAGVGDEERKNGDAIIPSFSIRDKLISLFYLNLHSCIHLYLAMLLPNAHSRCLSYQGSSQLSVSGPAIV